MTMNFKAKEAFILLSILFIFFFAFFFFFEMSSYVALDILEFIM